VEAARVRLFGTLEISLGDRRVSAFATKKSRALFAFLLLHPDRSHPRDLLAGTFWGELPEAVARKHLRDSLWRIRQVLRPIGEDSLALEVREDFVTVGLRGEGWLDTREFEDRLRRVTTRRAEETSASELEQLDTAIELFRGDLLEEIYDDWCSIERERYRTLAGEALHRLMTYHAYRREWGLAVQRGQRLLALSPLHEQVHRTLMRCYACSGNRGAAVRQFQICANLLREDLDVDPMKETVALYQSIRAGAIPLPVTAEAEPVSLPAHERSHPIEALRQNIS
jgi:DNA-binding SARP family transcriptional activator